MSDEKKLFENGPRITKLVLDHISRTTEGKRNNDRIRNTKHGRTIVFKNG